MVITSTHCDPFQRRHKHKHFQIMSVKFPSNLGNFAKPYKLRVVYVITKRGSRKLSASATAIILQYFTN
jgi:hypothetical protein